MRSRHRFPSDTYKIAKARRLRRIRNRACSELKQIYENGELSLRRFDLLSRLPPTKQRRLVAAEKSRRTAASLAAAAINRFLDSLGSGAPLRLSEISAAIRSVVRP